MPNQERTSILNELTPPLDVHMPEEWAVPFVFCSPHSGRVYPETFMAQSRLSPQALRRSEDCYIDELFDFAPTVGAPLIAARFPRAYVDVNREPYELDPELFQEALPDFANTQSVRVLGGLGTIARIVSDSEEIYDKPLSLAAAYERIDRLYQPFHTTLDNLLQTARDKFGYAVLIDCHSMPSASLSHPTARRPDFVLGDRFGSSCNTRLTRAFREAATELGYHAQLNRPYAGGFITEHYGRPQHRLHAIQIEINRGLYLHETHFKKTKYFDQLRTHLAYITQRLISETISILDLPQAAE